LLHLVGSSILLYLLVNKSASKTAVIGY